MFHRLLALTIAISTVACAAASPPSEDEATGASEEAITVLGPAPSGSPARYPIVLVHGFRASPSKYGFSNVAAALRADGHEVVEAALPPHESSEARARSLATQLAPVVTRTGKVNIVAHSMGGLDARVLVSELGWGDRVASVTTIATPHRGSAFADGVLGLITTVNADEALNALADAYDTTYSELAGGANLRAAYTQLSEAYAPTFNAAKKDDARVYYQSWAGVSNVFGIPNRKDANACEGLWWGQSSGSRRRIDRMNAQLWLVAPIVAHGAEMRPNDGLVTVESAKWGSFRGCIPADHLDEVGAGGERGTHSDSGFDHVRFYRNVAFELAAKGF
jgi:triacylglycerol lipase